MGKHRAGSQVPRRTILTVLAGAATGVTLSALTATGRLFQADVTSSLSSQPAASAQTPSSTPAPPTTSAVPTTSSQPATRSASPSSTRTTRSTPPRTSTSTPTRARKTSLADELAQQPRSGWGLTASAAASSHLLADKFGISQVLGYRANSDVADSDHPKRLAADFMTLNRTTNRALADFAIANQTLLRVKYVLSLQEYNDGSGWSAMEDRGGDTANHNDHTHISFY